MPGENLQIEEDLKRRLALRREVGLYRELRPRSNLIDFCSNDYLGFAVSPELRAAVDEAVRAYSGPLGATGSRLISGESELYAELESDIVRFHGAQAALIFNSGYDANIGLLSSIPTRHDTIIYDELAHASIIDGVRLSYARSYSFRHNDLDDLRKKLGSSRGRIYIVVESVYSMDGDFAPLNELCGIAREIDAAIIVDEAHASGVFGLKGEGRVVELGLEHEVFARMHTFGKALGVHGAAVLGPQTLREYLINHARSFIYTTALPAHSIIAIDCAYRQLERSASTINDLNVRIRHFLGLCSDIKCRIASDSPIQAFIVPGNDKARAAANQLQEAGFDVRPILSPTIRPGHERLRICIHAFNTLNQIEGMTEALKAALTC